MVKVVSLSSEGVFSVYDADLSQWFDTPPEYEDLDLLEEPIWIPKKVVVGKKYKVKKGANNA